MGSKRCQVSSKEGDERGPVHVSSGGRSIEAQDVGILGERGLARSEETQGNMIAVGTSRDVGL